MDYTNFAYGKIMINRHCISCDEFDNYQVCVRYAYINERQAVTQYHRRPYNMLGMHLIIWWHILMIDLMKLTR